jgi:ADP-heptose:LPS heptosyltransferase
MRNPPSDGLPSGSRVAIFRALPGLGDFLCMVPALRALRGARPDVEVVLIGLREAAPLAARYNAYIDRFLPFPGFPGLPERRPDVRRLPGFLASVQAADLDLAVQLHGSGELTNPIVCLFGARRVAGHYRPGSPPADAARFLPWRHDASEIRRSLRLMAHLGWSSDDESLEFPLDAAGDEEIESLATGPAAATLRAPFACLHPGAASASRRWPASEFAEVGDGLARAGLEVVITGSEAERDLAKQVVQAMHAPALDLSGRTSLDGLGALLRRAAVLVSNDTGVAHLADALRVPSVVIFTDSSADRWGPLDRRLHRVSHGPAKRVLADARQVARFRPTEPSDRAARDRREPEPGRPARHGRPTADVRAADRIHAA